VLSVCNGLLYSEEMEAFAERSMDCDFKFSWLQFCIVVLLSVVISVGFGVIFQWYVGVAIGCGLFILQYSVLGISSSHLEFGPTS
jgi:uncharacterized membrane protein YagU involved in acid resistance